MDIGCFWLYVTTYVMPFFQRLNWILFSNILMICTLDIRWKHTCVQTRQQSIYESKACKHTKIIYFADPMYIFSKNGSFLSIFWGFSKPRAYAKSKYSHRSSSVTSHIGEHFYYTSSRLSKFCIKVSTWVLSSTI